MYNEGELTLVFELDGGYGNLSAEVRAQGFSGFTDYCADAQDLETFVDALAAFPLRKATLTIGAERDDGPLIAIDISQADSTGRFKVWVELVHYADPRRRVSADFVTVYWRLEAFGRSLRQMLSQGGATTLRSTE